MSEPKCDIEDCPCEGTNPDHFEVTEADRCVFTTPRRGYTCRMPEHHYWHDPEGEWYDHPFIRNHELPTEKPSRTEGAP
jgi:hypothetical protein